MSTRVDTSMLIVYEKHYKLYNKVFTTVLCQSSHSYSTLVSSAHIRWGFTEGGDTEMSPVFKDHRPDLIELWSIFMLPWFS